MSSIKKFLAYIIPYIGIVIFSFLLTIVMEWIFRGSANAVKLWAQTEYHEFIYVSLFISSLFIMLYGFKRKLFLSISVVVATLLIGLSVANRVKIALRGDPLIPADLVLVSEAKNMLSIFSDLPFWQIALTTIAIVSIILVIGYGIHKLPKDKTWNIHRVVLAAFAASLLFCTYNEEVEKKHSMIRAKYKIKVIDYNQQTNYDLNGVLMAFMRNIKWLSIDAPTDYTEEKIKEIAQKYEQEPYELTEDKPHIVMIMSEAFWDPTVMESVSFSEDPLPNFHELAKNYTSGNLLAPVFGGSTANTEFESLTGYSMNFLPAGSIPYLFHVKKPIQALPHILKGQGYNTTAIHSYHNWFYQRNTVYKNIGFDRFISLEFVPEPVVDFLYYRDREMNDLIIDQLTNAQEPNFIFGVTMQNHGPFKADMKKPYSTIEVEHKDGSFTPEAKNILEFFSDNMVQVDLELIRLIEKLDELDEKVMVVYYGDHLPLLGLNYQVYKEAGYFEKETDFEAYKKIYSTPLLMWDNFSSEHKKVDLSASYLSAYVLNRAGLQGTPLTNMLNTALADGRGMLPRADYVPNFWFDTTLLQDYEALQYDYLFGGGKYDTSAKVDGNKEFRLGYNDPLITRVIAKEANGAIDLVVEGNFFTKSAKIFIDGNRVDTVYEDGELKATLTEISNGSIVQVKIIDSNDRALSNSNLFTFSR